MKEPWWRKQTKHWYVEVDGKQVRLSQEKDPDGETRKYPPPAVEREWHRILREGSQEDMQLGDLLDAFLRSLPDGDNKETSTNQLKRFERFAGREMKISRLKPLKLTEYLQENAHWKPSTVRTVVNRIHAALNWGVRQGLISVNPISETPGYKREGRFQRRRGLISDKDCQIAETNAGREFRAILIGLRETGARPSELSRAQIEKVNLAEGYMDVPNKTAHQTGESERRIYFSAEMKELVKELIGDRTEGYVFRNKLGKPWNAHSLKQRWRVLREKTGIKGVLYQYRHGFASKAINETNVNPALVAQLLGHTDLQMLLKHYLEENPEALKKAVDEITKKKEG